MMGTEIFKINAFWAEKLRKTRVPTVGEGPSRGLLRDYKHSHGPSFQALISSPQSPHGCTGPTFKWHNFNTFIIQDKTSKSGK